MQKNTYVYIVFYNNMKKCYKEKSEKGLKYQLYKSYLNTSPDNKKGGGLGHDLVYQW